MMFAETFSSIESLMPALIGASLGILAIAGVKELFKEAKTALK